MTIDCIIGRKTLVEGDKGDMYFVANNLILPEAPCFPGADRSAHRNVISLPYHRDSVTRFLNAIGKASPRLRGKLDQTDLTGFKVTKMAVRDAKVAVLLYRSAHPEAEPDFTGSFAEDFTLARLELMAWWMRYSFNHF